MTTQHGQLPSGLQLQRTTDLFDADTVPRGLLRAHRIASDVWGEIVVVSGAVDFVWESGEPPVALSAGDRLVIPPQTPHHVELGPDACFRVSFYR